MNRTTAPRRALLGGAAALTAVLLTVAGCGGGHDAADMNHGGTGTTSAPAASGETFNGEDVRFAQMMIPHHQQAVQMSELAETRASDPELKELAAKIKAAQDPEITTMAGWLTAWGKPTEAPGGSMHGDHGGMPGMMSEEDMTALRDAKGTAFDKMFAEMMIAHHQGAIQMARNERSNGADAQAKALAERIETSQAAEIEQLKGILDRL